MNLQVENCIVDGMIDTLKTRSETAYQHFAFE
ncbi:MAG: hypothetical protein ACI9CU_000562 [Polaribacter sp.]|jgi:hypothetical protein